MANWTKTAAIALAATSIAVAAPASATIFEYNMTNGDVLTIDTANGSGTWKGSSIDQSFTGDFSSFQGGPNPSFMGELTSLTGFRIIGGKQVTATNFNNGRFHPFKLKTKSGNRFNLWAWWGDPVVSGDYVRKIGSFKVIPPVDVPAPGALGLFGLALVALGFGRRRRKAAVA
ncbi:MAG: PEP-CTERM sorting domain-containing protein [Pseudomonadota bacterium]